MNNNRLTAWARSHLEQVLSNGKGLTPGELTMQEPELEQRGACFVTLTQNGRLRGCIGTIAAHRSLANDLLENAVSAATRDPRFAPLTRAELPSVAIEVSILTPAVPLSFQDGDDLLRKLQPGVHGVIVSQEGHRATFLPQVWEQLPDPHLFMEHLCRKAGMSGDCWRRHPKVEVYTVEKYHESKGAGRGEV